MRSRLRTTAFCVFTLIQITAAVASGAVRVVNDGVPGESSAEISERLEAALKQYKPNFVVIFAGTNDAVNDGKFLPAKTTALYISSMTRRSKAIGSKVVIVSVHEPDTVRLFERHKPDAYGDFTPGARVQALDRALKRVARNNRSALADFHEALIKAGGPNPDLSTDGVHLSARGYGLLAATVRKALPKRLPKNSTVLCIGDSLTYGIGVRPPGNAPEGDKTYPAQLQELLNRDSGVKQ
jgi:acyl-CoA thioesterase I